MMLLEAGLSFLGLGVPSPAPSWGNMIADGWHKMSVAWWSSTFPGLAISLVVMALNAVGDALRDALDPRDRKSTRLNSSHSQISYAVFCLKKKKNTKIDLQTVL